MGPQTSRAKLHTEVISVLLSGYLGTAKKGVKENDCDNQNFKVIKLNITIECKETTFDVFN